MSQRSDEARPLSIAYIGDFSRSWFTETHIVATLKSMGHKVTPIWERDLTSSRKMLKELKAADLVLYTRHHGLPGWASDVWYALTTDGVPTVSFHLDLFWGLAREKLIHNQDPMFTTQWVVTPDGGADERWEEAGIEHLWSPPACFGPEVGLAKARAEYECDVMFVGSDGDQYHREWPHRKALVDWLRSTYGSRFVRLGSPNMVRGTQLSEAYASAKVVVGDSCLLGTKYWSDRVPDTLGRGGVLIMPHQISRMRDKALTEWHPQVETWQMFQWDELRALIDKKLAMSDRARKRLRQDGVADVKERHTYANRMQHIFDTVGVT